MSVSTLPALVPVAGARHDQPAAFFSSPSFPLYAPQQQPNYTHPSHWQDRVSYNPTSVFLRPLTGSDYAQGANALKAMAVPPPHRNDMRFASAEQDENRDDGNQFASGMAAMSLRFIVNDMDGREASNTTNQSGEEAKPLVSDASMASDDDESGDDRSSTCSSQQSAALTPSRRSSMSSSRSPLELSSLLNTVCAKPACSRAVRGPSGTFCKYHKQSRFCRAVGCPKSAKTGGFCISHGGGKRCAVPACAKSAKQGGLCISHGGGKRCGEAGCTKSALVGGLCSAHGGGRKCQTPACNKTALLGGLCIAHGGGKRCQVQGCARSAVGGMLCVSHGGGKRCQTPGCSKGAVRNGVCIRHGAKRDGGGADTASDYAST